MHCKQFYTIKQSQSDIGWSPNIGCIGNFSGMRTSSLGFKPECEQVIVCVVFICHFAKIDKKTAVGFLCEETFTFNKYAPTMYIYFMMLTY